MDRRAAKRCLFATLTYPQEWERWSPEESKLHLDALRRQLVAEWPEVSVIWRLERQRRGAPHYHLLIFGVPYVPAMWLAATWYTIVGSGDPKHLQAGTEVRACRTWRAMASYVSKYLAKVDDGEVGADWWAFPGRFWGVWNGGVLPVELVEVPVPEETFHQLRRVLRKYLERRGVRVPFKGRLWAGLSVFMGWEAGARLLLEYGVQLS